MQGESPFFSVVIPTYNRADFILQTLNTVFNQSFQDYEIIVADDCSTDNTKEILQPLIAQHKIKFVQHDQNYERGKTRNTGMLHAQGKYLTFLDSDDFMYPDNLKDAYEYAVQHPEKKVFHNLYELINPQREVLYKYDFRPLKNPLKQLAEGNFLSCHGVFLHREVYSTVFWDENRLLSGSEDHEYWLRVLAHYPDLGRINKINTGVVEHAQRSVNTAQVTQGEHRFEYFFQKIDTDPVYQTYYKPYLNKIKSTCYIFLSLMAFNAGDIQKMKYYKQKALTLDKSLFLRKNYLYLTYQELKTLFGRPKTT
jgi:glycosyltransferase involved in cell wall biosynthesis